MAIIKQSTFPAFNQHGEPLVRLLSELPGPHMEKTAGIHPEILAYKSQLEPEPGKTYVHILALGAGDFYGANLNNDHFPWQGLSHDHTNTPHPYMHGFKTFLNAHAFAHHVNKDPEKAYGDVLLSVLNKKMKRVELIVAIDEEKCVKNGGQRTLDKIKAGEYPSTSMGCRVPFDVCSICGHKAKYRSEYCEHMRNSAGKIMADGRKVFVYNPYPRFFDISFVFIGADRTSFVLEKVAQVKQANVFKSGMEAVKNFNTSGALKLGLGGAALGAGTGAMSASDGNRIQGALRGLAVGGALGGLGGGFNSGALGVLGASAGASHLMTNKQGKLPPPPAQTSSLNQQKTASDAGMGRALRRSSGTVKKRAGKYLKKKVQKKKNVLPKALTFSKLKTSGDKNKLIWNTQPPPLPDIFVKNGLEMRYERLQKNASFKSAEVQKLSDIFKDVNAHPMGKAVPIMVGKDPDLPIDMLDRISKSPDLGQTLGGIASSGIVLKPREFQRIVLVRTGQSDLADDLHRSGKVFEPSPVVDRSLRIKVRPPEGGIPSGLLDLISNAVRHRSSLSPLALRRPQGAGPSIKVTLVRSPMLSKVASLYNGYREDLLLNSEKLIKSAMNTPMLMKTIEDVRGGSFCSPDIESLMHIPIAYFSHAYWNRCCCDSQLNNKEFAEKFVEENPEISKYLSLYVAKRSDMI